ncbi:MAG: NADP-dependent malic enzyme [Flavobacteriales bacterium]|nr:NADP-dependent malic enzyme [Flavobacteriales bacterium]MDG1781411.1 NADP-dependent malic enzyme [Flavobacteriales bacterium]MDG2247352.1 NADP-dependent malic enzyme [Flavobacteriales bacterium]
MNKIRKQEALDYHSSGRKGKLEVIPSKPYSSQRDLSLAYSPGVAEPCLEIADNKEDVYKYTTKGNLVAVISNGTAVLGLGDIGPEASKPVMEGKGLLFKIFADIDVFDIEVDATNVDHFVSVVKAIAPTFGGINLEDIKAPEAFEIERRLVEELDIPVMHDDQHGTAIISSAALLNALELAEKDISSVKIVVSGAGAAAMSCLDLYLKLGAKKENILVYDSKGLVTTSRDNLDERKKDFAVDSEPLELAEALKGADVFLGLSKGGIMTADMVKDMANDPIVFALANPDPEIPYNVALKAREDVIMATGRSDHPNQVNNVLGFPYIFRGALDVRATCINDEMKLAAVRAIAELAKESVPDEVNEAYDVQNIAFGRDLIIPKPLDPRLITAVASAVAKAAMESGVAKLKIEDWAKYKQDLSRRLGRDSKLIRNISVRAKKKPKRVVFAEADHYKILKAAEQALDEGIAHPILLGEHAVITEMIETNNINIDLDQVEIIDPRSDSERKRREEFEAILYALRQRKGMTQVEARKAVRDRNYFGAMLVHTGQADSLISGLTRNYRNVIRPAIQILGMEDEVKKVAGMYIVQSANGPIFFADTTVNMDPTAEEICDITLLVAKAVKRMQMTPRVAMLSYSNFGSSEGKDASKMSQAAEMLHQSNPELIVDGEIQANFALNKDLIDENFPFSRLKGKKVNTLIFPNLASGNIAYKLMQEMGEKEIIGPILLGMKKSFHILQMGSSVREIVNMVRIAVVDAQTK